MSGKENPFAKFLSRYKKGDFVFQQDEEGDETYIVQSGRVAIRKKIGGKGTTVTVLEKGDFFGEMSVLERLPRTADAEVIEDSGIIRINSQTFGEMIRSNPEIAVRMLRKYSMRMREYSDQLEKLIALQEDSSGGAEVPEMPDVDTPSPAPEGTVALQGQYILYRRRDRLDERNLYQRQPHPDRRAHAHQRRRRGHPLQGARNIQDGGLISVRGGLRVSAR